MGSIFNMGPNMHPNIMIIRESNRYKSKGVKVKPGAPIPGCIYRGDTGNNNWVIGILVRVDDDDAIIMDARGKEHVVLTMMLRSMQ